MKPEKAVFRQKRFTSPLLFGYNGFKEKELKRELDSNNGYPAAFAALHT